VEDTGPGIPEEEQEDLFARFARSSPQGKDQAGTGIGLALAKECTALHGGTIAVDSAPGAGSTFTVRLPLPTVAPDAVEQSWTDRAPDAAPPQRPDDPRPGAASGGEGTGDGHAVGDGHVPSDERVTATPGDAPSADGKSTQDADKGGTNASETATENGAAVSEAEGTGKATILIADDNADVRAYLSRHLRSRWHVIETANGAEALERAQETSPDLVLADVMMPKLNGRELARRLRAGDDTCRIPILLLTARAAEEDAVAGLEAGADYVTKPFSVDELQARIGRLLDARAAWAEDGAATGGLVDPDVELTTPDEAFLDRVTDTLDAHLDRASLTVDDLASEVGISPRQLQRKLKRLTGCTAGQFIKKYRVECAAELLANNTDAVAQVAYRVGFNTPKTFRKHFEEHVGCAPSAYAEQQAA
jgi:DNA-binding response OmpR family regulator